MKLVMFPGQGSQFVGMGVGLLERFPEMVAEASDILGYSIADLCLEGPEARLNRTLFTQPAVYVVNALGYRNWRDEHGEPDGVLGHSLGEYSALGAAGCFDFSTGLRLVRKRSELMEKAPRGVMAAVLGMAADGVRDLLNIGGLVDVDFAGLNSPTQVVISGLTAAMRSATELLSRHGLKVIVLPISIPSHSRHMRGIEGDLAAFLAGLSVAEPRLPVIANVTARPYRSGELAALLTRQLSEPVRWQESIEWLARRGPCEFVEIGADPDRVGGVALSKLAAEVIGLAALTAPSTSSRMERLPLAASRADPIAVIGMSARFPGASDLDALWANLRAGRNSITKLPPSRWEGARAPSVLDAGVIDGMDEFDPLFFGISPREALGMDPQHRLLMTHVHHAIEDAGYSVESLSGSNTALLIGTHVSGYAELLGRAGGWRTATGMTGLTGSMGPNRMSYWLNWHGPSEPVETACSSALVAAHRAMNLLQSGACDQAVIGGVNTLLWPDGQESFALMGALSEDGRCKPFSTTADGYVRAEGVGMLFLKPLAAAERDGDHVYGLLTGSAQNHGGRARSLTAPNPFAQAELITAAIRSAGIDVRTIGYVEAHGTGTPLGDPIEVHGLSRAFRTLAGDTVLPPASIGLGSIKGNIGHSELAAGAAGLIKVLLQLRHRELVPSINALPRNPKLRLENTPFFIVDEARPWPASAGDDGELLPRRAGVSSFGFGGVNAHLVVEEYRPPVRPANPVDRPVVILLSARTQEQLDARVFQLRSHLAAQDENLVDLAYTLQVGRSAMRCRLALIVDDLPTLRDRLAAIDAGATALPESWRGTPPREPTTTGGAQARRIVAEWIAAGALSKLAQGWCEGMAVDWALLWRDRAPRRLSLPSYPFARERYWLREQSADTDERLHEAGAVTIFEEVWEEAPASEGKRSVGAVLCLLSDPAQRSQAASFLAKRAPRCRIGFVTSDAESTDETAGVFHLPDGADDAACSAVLQRAVARLGPLDALLHLSAIKGAGQAEDVEGVVRWLRATNRSGIDCERIVLTGWADTDEQQAFLEARIGMTRSLSLTLPRTRVSAMTERSATPADVATWLDRIWLELESDYAPGVLFDGGRRHVGAIIPMADYEHGEVAESVFRHGGTYWITGGLGELGAIVAEHLARTYRARLILTGRSPLDDDARRRIAILEAEGAEVLHAVADVSDEPAMQKVLEAALVRFGQVQGVIHVAGAADDKVLLDKDDQALSRDLASKVEGTRVLDRILSKQPLEFFCCFASLAAVLGDFGAASYSMANRYQMAHARLRQARVARGEARGRTVAIGWPLWRDGGMKLGTSDQTRLYLRSSGQRPLKAAEGLAQLEALLRSGSSQPLVVAGDLDRVGQALRKAVVAGPRREVRSAPEGLVSARQHEDNSSPGHLVEDLLDQVQGVLGIPRAMLSADGNLADYGFDSLALVTFSQQLSDRYGIDVTPARLLRYPTVERIAAFLRHSHADDLAAAIVETPVRTVEASSSAGERRRVLTARSRAGRQGDIATPIAIIAMNAHFPEAPDLAAFWRNLAAGRDCVREIPAVRWGDGEEAGLRERGRWAGLIDGAFDPANRFFKGHTSLEGVTGGGELDLFLATVHGLLDGTEHVGNQRRRGDLIGLYVGTMPTVQSSGTFVSTTSRAFGLAGPSIAVDAHSASSMTALHMACLSVAAGECDLAIAGGVSLFSPRLIATDALLASQPRHRSFSALSDGLLFADGSGAVLLQPLDQAVADGNEVLAVLRSTGAAFIGTGRATAAAPGLPDVDRLADAIAATIARSGVGPAAISYVEAAAGGLQLGDAAEVIALSAAFCRSMPSLQSCAVGSVESNIGHAAAACGMAGLIKTVLQLRHQTIVPSIGIDLINPDLQLDDSPFHVAQAAISWRPAPDGELRRALVNSLGYGGFYGGAVVEEHGSVP